MSTSITEKEYRTTKEQCQLNIHGVCSGCGGQLVPIETVDNSGNPTFWPGCEECSCFDYGVKQLTFDIAKALVIEHNHVHYSHMDNPWGRSEEYKKYWFASQIRGTCGLVSTILSLKEKLIR